MVKTQTIQWAPFSQKHINYIKNAMKNVLSVAEGSVRSGKTIDHCIIASMYLEICPDKLHLASGSSLPNAKLNIGDCNGFGLEHIFRGRCRWGKYKDNEALYINTQTGEKIVIFAGGGKADSYKKILGNSYGLWIATEINEHYDSEDSRTSFIKVAFARQIASKKPFTLWDLNPCAPGHKIYTDYIDNYLKNGLKGGYQYQHFTLHDNLTITKERLEEIESKYDKNSVWYARDILGKRVAAEGLIYRLFANETEKFLIDTTDKNYMIVSIGIDYGAGASKIKFVATGITYNFQEVDILDEYDLKSVYDPEEIYKHFIIFYKRVYERYGKCQYTFADYGALGNVITLGLIRRCQKENVPTVIEDCSKDKINDRIFLTSTLMAQGRLKVLRKNQVIIQAFKDAIWNSKHQDERLDDGTTDIDSLDAFEYSINSFYENLINSRR